MGRFDDLHLIAHFACTMENMNFLAIDGNGDGGGGTVARWRNKVNPTI